MAIHAPHGRNPSVDMGCTGAVVRAPGSRQMSIAHYPPPPLVAAAGLGFWALTKALYRASARPRGLTEAGLPDVSHSPTGL